MKPVLLWSKSLADIATYLARRPEEFTVIDTNSDYDSRTLSALRSDTPVFDPFPKSGKHYRDFLTHVNASHCRYHIVGLAACQDVFRTLKDPKLSSATIEEVLLALGYHGEGSPKRRQQVIPPLTIFLSRLIGLFLVLLSSGAVVHHQITVETINALLNNRPLSLIVGTIVVLGGLAMVLTHNLWSNGALSVVITILGWVILAGGLFLLFSPPSSVVTLWPMLIITLALGLYLSYSGFKSSLSSAPHSKR